MKRSALKTYLNGFSGAQEEYPFGPQAVVFKVGKKMFALLTTTESDVVRLNLKCDPEWALTLRASYEAIVPGYHMNKTHWNSVLFDGSLSEEQVKEMVEHSYELVLASLSKKVREQYARTNT